MGHVHVTAQVCPLQATLSLYQKDLGMKLLSVQVSPSGISLLPLALSRSFILCNFALPPTLKTGPFSVRKQL